MFLVRMVDEATKRRLAAHHNPFKIYAHWRRLVWLVKISPNYLKLKAGFVFLFFGCDKRVLKRIFLCIS